MAAATRQDINKWFDDGVDTGASHMIVVCDGFDQTDYPVYVYGEDPREKADRFGRKPMQRVMEVYAMHLDKYRQLDAARTMIFEEPPVRAQHVIQEEP